MVILAFTDLDGSLLNHGDYSFEAARPSLARLREVEPLQNELGVDIWMTTSAIPDFSDRLTEAVRLDNAN